MPPTSSFSTALALHLAGDLTAAEPQYRALLQDNPRDAQVWLHLGLLYFAQANYPQAEQAFREAIATDPTQFSPYFNLGNSLVMQHQIDGAIAAYRQAIARHPRHPDTLFNLGLVLQTQGETAEAALRLGDACYYQGKFAEAIPHYEQYATLETGDISFYGGLARCYQTQNQHDRAIQTYQQGIAHHPQAVNLYFWLMVALEEAARPREAIAIGEQAARQFPDQPFLRFEAHRVIPYLYDTVEEISGYRDRFAQGLQDLLQSDWTHQPETLQGLLRRTNFYLHYQGQDDRDLQLQYGQVIHETMVTHYPQWQSPPLPRPLTPDRKIRIGYLSGYMRWHTVGRLFAGWVQQADRQQFALYCYYTDRPVDAVTQQFQQGSDRFHHLPDNLEGLCSQIRSDELDILVFLDLGMDPQAMAIAGLNLAPVQCAAWGHPITSGLPTIRYFLSSDAMEPEQGANHYSETLIRLPKLGVSYPKPDIPELTKTRADFGLPEDALIYLSCQSLYKYLPQHDRLFVAIAQQLPQACFVFVRHPSTAITEQFQQRLQRAFAQAGLDSTAHCRILPRFSITDYWNLNQLADVFLDTPDFSGCMTTLDALTCELPVVTYPSEFMRGCQSAGILRLLGVTDTIARDAIDYVRIAVELGRDPQWRSQIKRRLVEHHSQLFGDQTCLQALEDFYRQVVQPTD